MTPFSFQTATLSRPGTRASNEDACDWRDGLWVVADGLGGHGGGEIASRLAVAALLAALPPGTPLNAEPLERAVTAAAASLRARRSQEPSLSGMRTTLVALMSDGEHALWLHLGDSRCYAFRAGRLLFQTADHSVPQALVRAGELSPEAIRFHEDRNRLLRTLGDQRPPRPTLAEAPLRLQPGDAFLLCTDGLWEAVTESEMESALAESSDPTQWLTRLELYLAAQARPDQDNYTAIAVFVDTGGAPA